MKNLLKISLTLVITAIFVTGIVMPEILMGTPASTAIGNWYQQFLPNIGGRTILDITFIDSLTGYSITTISSDTSYVLKTTDAGDSWFINYRAASSIFRKIQFINNNTGYIGGQNLFKTTNAGGSWSIIYPSLFSEDMYFINNDTAWYADPNSFAGGVFFTSNGGVNWQQQLNIGSQNPTNIYFYDKDTGFTAKNTLYKTTNGGLNWNLVPGGTGFSDMFFINSVTGWKCYGPMQKTTNEGLNWINQVLPSGGIILDNSMIRFSNFGNDTMWGTGGLVFYGAGQFRGIIYRTINGGTTWQFQIPDTAVHSGTYQHIQFVNKHNGWAYWPVGGVHTTNGGDPIWLTGITQINTEVPKEFKLYQNYPNPFNPVTNIKYSVKRQKSNVKLTVFDILGKQIAELVNQKQNAGTYQVDFSGNGCASGIYFYKLTVSNRKELFSETKKMILIK